MGIFGGQKMAKNRYLWSKFGTFWSVIFLHFLDIKIQFWAWNVSYRHIQNIFCLDFKVRTFYLWLGVLWVRHFLYWHIHIQEASHPQSTFAIFLPKFTLTQIYLPNFTLKPSSFLEQQYSFGSCFGTSNSLNFKLLLFHKPVIHIAHGWRMNHSFMTDSPYFCDKAGSFKLDACLIGVRSGKVRINEGM